MLSSCTRLLSRLLNCVINPRQVSPPGDPGLPGCLCRCNFPVSTSCRAPEVFDLPAELKSIPIQLSATPLLTVCAGFCRGRFTPTLPSIRAFSQSRRAAPRRAAPRAGGARAHARTLARAAHPFPPLRSARGTDAYS